MYLAAVWGGLVSEQAPENTDLAILPVPLRTGGRLGSAAVAGAWAFWAGLLLLTALGRSWLDAPIAVSIGVSVLPYLFATFGALVFGLWCVVPDRRSLPVLMLAWVLSGAALWSPSVGRSAAPPDENSLRVISWNVRRLWGSAPGVVTEAQINAATKCVQGAIEEHHPDVLILLEISSNDLQKLNALNLKCVQGDYYGTGGAESAGVAVCTRGSAALLRGAPRRFVDADPWSYVFAEVEYQGEVFNVMGVHLEPYHSEAQALKAGIHGIAQGDPDGVLQLQRAGESVVRAQVDQSGALIDALSRLQDPTLVGGDFNSTPDMALHVNLRQILQDTWLEGGRGFGTTARVLGQLPVRIDYVYATPGFHVLQTMVPDANCSDHRAVIADLRVEGMDDATVGVQEK